MYKKISVLVVSILLMSFNINGLKIGGIEMPDTIKKGDVVLKLNGAGVRDKYFMNLYVGGLYLQQKNNNANAVINADENMAMRLHIVSSLITSEKMEDATREGFENTVKENANNIQQKIDSFIDVFKEEIKDDDVFEMVYVSGKGVEVYKNNMLASTIKGLDFKKALFGIWLGDKPAQKSLKKDMLGN
ncbi:MAG: chalcone isomerase family protein [Ichthyobacteriaceae bacterium]|nr:chalcone isomerase family protein [Ichthyobacteriaceae bacterium]